MISRQRNLQIAQESKADCLSAAIGVFAGFLGVGPGFLLMPSLVMLGYTARIAAATNSVIVTMPSFSAFIAHLADAQFDWLMVGLTSVTASDRGISWQHVHRPTRQEPDAYSNLCCCIGSIGDPAHYYPVAG